MVGFTSRKIDRAKLAREIYSNLGLPTVKTFKRMVSTNMISNCPISVEDIINAENIYGHQCQVSKSSQQGENQGR